MGNNNYEITLSIKEDTTANTSPFAGGTMPSETNDTSKKANTATKQSGNSEKNAIKGALNAYKSTTKAFATIGATQVANTLINSQMSTIALKTGRNEYQDRVQTTFGIVNEVSSLAMSTLTTTAINPVLGAITLASGLMVKAVQYGTQQNALQIAQDNENTEHSLMRKRMGGNGRRSSTN